MNTQPDGKYSPYNGIELFSPMDPELWRLKGCPAWEFDPWTGEKRESHFVEEDPLGVHIWHKGWGDNPRAAQPDIQYSPFTGSKLDESSTYRHPDDWRGDTRAWRFDPWTRMARSAENIKADPQGRNIWHAGWVFRPAAPAPVETKPEVDALTATLNERGTRYGAFVGHAEVTQRIKTALFDRRPRQLLASDQVEALEMIAHKLGRIVNGDPDYVDSWIDIAGYAKLVADRLREVDR